MNTFADANSVQPAALVHLVCYNRDHFNKCARKHVILQCYSCLKLEID